MGSIYYAGHNAPYLPTKVLHLLRFSFLLGITSLLHSRTKNGCVADYRVLLGITPVPREIENITYAKLGGTNKVHYGTCARDLTYHHS